MLVCTGFRQGLSLTCRWLRANGVETVALEDPGWHARRLIVEEAGLAVAPVPVDDEGIDVAALSAIRRRRGRRHADAPVPHGRGAESPPPCGADGVGRARRPPDRRGRLRRRAGPRARRCIAGPRARPRPAHRLGEQAPDPGHAPRLDAHSLLAVLGAHLGQGDRGRGLGGRRPARARRLHRRRRARAPPAADAPALRTAAGGTARRPGRGRYRAGGRPPPSAACTSSSCSRARSTRRRCWPPRRAAGSASRACRCTATRETARPGWCWGTPTWPSPRSNAACSSSRPRRRRGQGSVRDGQQFDDLAHQRDARVGADAGVAERGLGKAPEALP